MACFKANFLLRTIKYSLLRTIKSYYRPLFTAELEVNPLFYCPSCSWDQMGPVASADAPTG